MNKEAFHQIIKSNIEKFGYHITYVMADISPAFAYSIGLREKFNFEIIFAGGAYYTRREVEFIITSIADKIFENGGKNFEVIEVGDLGKFSFSSVDHSWSKLLMLGVYDYYKLDEVSAFQIVPDSDHYTFDIPNMSKKFSVESEPVWQWMIKDWEYDVPKDSTVGTDIWFLRGNPITEISKWEDNYWEMYHIPGDVVEKEDIRIVSLGTVLALDPSVLAALKIPLTKGLYRENIDEPWKKWNW